MCGGEETAVLHRCLIQVCLLSQFSIFATSKNETQVYVILDTGIIHNYDV